MIRNCETVTLTDPAECSRFEAVRLSDEQTAAVLGWTVEDLRAARSAPSRGTVTVTSIDRAAGVLVVR